MTRLTRLAVCLPLLCSMLTGAISAFGRDSADAGPDSRYVMAPADPTRAPADPRAGEEPRDMTLHRTNRRALRGRSRDRVAPETPASMQSLPDMTVSPHAAGMTSGTRRFDPAWQTAPSTSSRVKPNERSQTEPTPSPAPRPVLAATAIGNEVRLTQAQDANRVAPNEPAVPPIVPDAPTPLELNRSRSLNKPIREIGLVEPVDLEGQRPVNVAGELQGAAAASIVVGSPFACAHPQRYTFCFSHNPLYFEDANLERCGVGHGLCQPAVSAAQFLGRTALLPYSVIANPPCDCVTTLGDCPTCHRYPCGTDVNR